MLLVLEDLHWADASTLDLVSFLAHHLNDSPVMLVASCREDEAASATRMRRLVDGVRRSESGLKIELGSLEAAELLTLVTAHAEASLPPSVSPSIVTRSEGNPFFAEELLAASEATYRATAREPARPAAATGRPAGSGPRSALLRMQQTEAAGREVPYSPATGPEQGLADTELRESLRRAVDNGAFLADHAARRFRFRHALLAEAIYTTILPGERK